MNAGGRTLFTPALPCRGRFKPRPLFRTGQSREPRGRTYRPRSRTGTLGNIARRLRPRPAAWFRIVRRSDQLRPPPLGNLEIEGAGHMHGLHVLDPREGDVVIRPAACHRNGHLVRFGPIEDPVPQGIETLKHIERMLRTIYSNTTPS